MSAGRLSLMTGVARENEHLVTSVVNFEATTVTTINKDNR